MQPDPVTIRQVAILMVVAVLIGPVAVRAHSLASLSVHHATAGCLHADRDEPQDSSDDAQGDIRCCELDSPYDTLVFQILDLKIIEGRIVCQLTGRALDGYRRQIYVPPR